MSRIRHIPFELRRHVSQSFRPLQGEARYSFRTDRYTARIIDHHEVIIREEDPVPGTAIIKALEALGRKYDEDPRGYPFNFPWGMMTVCWEAPEIGGIYLQWSRSGPS